MNPAGVKDRVHSAHWGKSSFFILGTFIMWMNEPAGVREGVHSSHWGNIPFSLAIKKGNLPQRAEWTLSFTPAGFIHFPQWLLYPRGNSFILPQSKIYLSGLNELSSLTPTGSFSYLSGASGRGLFHISEGSHWGKWMFILMIQPLRQASYLSGLTSSGEWTLIYLSGNLQKSEGTLPPKMFCLYFCSPRQQAPGPF